ncbi:MAG TPA: ornithine cyclodeaminase family protein [Pyrinomonadaceae bacterium]|nr:ornithine cyclodeaminase family protein [Pyrinomonadaceae bacterium]
MKILDEEAVRRFLRMEELIPAMASALADLSSKKAVQPVRTVVPVADHAGFFGVMPAYNHALGAKLVTFYPENKGIHTHNGLIVLFLPETGEPIAVMDGRYITEMRTAAVSAVATDLLARQDVEVLAILGSGVQARSHLEALRLVRHFREVRVWSPRNAKAFADKHGLTAAKSPEAAVRGADVIAVVTSAKSPVLFGGWVKAGAHINAVGANRPNWRELDNNILEKSRIYVESRDSAAVESGDIIAAGTVFAEIGEVVSGGMPGRQSDDEITLFKSLGTAVEDIAAADLVYQKATQANV